MCLRIGQRAAVRCGRNPGSEATPVSRPASKVQEVAVEFLDGWQAIHPKEVNVRNSKTMLIAVALTLVALTAWAGDDAVARPAPDNDKSNVRPAQPAEKSVKPDQSAKPTPKADRASQPKADQSSEPGSEAEQAHQNKPEAVQAPATTRPWESWTIATPPAKSEPSEKGDIDRPPRGGQGGGRGGRGGHGGGGNGGRGGHGGGGHFRGGPGWHGHHDAWRHSHYHGSWSFLFHWGPVIYPVPVYYPHVVRMPRHRVGVYVRQTGSDDIGIRFAQSLREHLREQGLRVVYSPDDAQLELYAVSMDEDPEETGYGSAVSVSYIWYPGHRFITAQIIDVGVDEVDDLAQEVASYADNLVDQYR
jgi:hypothetical protein